MKIPTLCALTLILFFFGLEIAHCETRWVPDGDGQEKEQEWVPTFHPHTGKEIGGNWSDTGQTRSISRTEEPNAESTPSATPMPTPKTGNTPKALPATSRVPAEQPNSELVKGVSTEFVKGIVDKVVDKLAGPIFGVDPSSIVKVAEAKNLKEAVSESAKEAVSNVLEKILTRVNPALGLLDLALESTPTVKDDGIKYPDSPPLTHKERKDNNIPRPKWNASARFSQWPSFA